MKKLTFEELQVSEEILKAVKDMGFEEASPIQSAAIPVLMTGKDIIGQAQTGTGKTVAFGIPVVEKLNPKIKDIQALILCPTRELCIQVSEEIGKLLKYKSKLDVLPIYGGQSIERQFQGLKKKPAVVVGTPGRVIDHIERGTLEIHSLNSFVLDEADEMLSMGFEEDIEKIIKQTPEEKQTIFFSATMPKQIMALTSKYQKNPELVKVVHNELTVPSIEQTYFEVKDANKLEALTRLIDVNNINLGLIFCNTKRRVDELVENLHARGYAADALHGDMKQFQRDQVMKKFRAGHTELLVATDVAARGIDVDDIEVVINYDIPYDEEAYVHRIGRTGRASKKGKAFTFVTGSDIFRLKDIKRYTKSNIVLGKIPLLNEVHEIRINDYLSKVKQIIETESLDKYIRIIEKRVEEEDFSITELSAAMLKMQLGLVEKSEDEFSKVMIEEKKRLKASNAGKVTRFFFTLGHRDKITPSHIVGAIAGETGIPGHEIGEIDIYENFSFVEIPEEYTKEFLDIMNKVKIKGKPVAVEQAQEGKKDSKRGSGKSKIQRRTEKEGTSSKPRERDSYSKSSSAPSSRRKR